MAKIMVEPTNYTTEHQKITSRINGRQYEISLGEHSGMVPKNPFASQAQAGYMHTHPEVLGAKGLKEWDNATRGKHLPKHAKR